MRDLFGAISLIPYFVFRMFFFNMYPSFSVGKTTYMDTNMPGKASLLLPLANMKQLQYCISREQY